MKVKTIHYKRVKNLGSYESETFEMTADIDEKDELIEVAEQLQEYVLYMLGIDNGKVPARHYTEDGETISDF
ncbi:MAG: hypothetical protein AAF915_02015 [Cyanobacteria bacterium P01_D01_bin.50]